MLTASLARLLFYELVLLILTIFGDCSPGSDANQYQDHRFALRHKQFPRQSTLTVAQAQNDGGAFIVIPLVGNLTTGRWFGTFNIGDSQPLELLIDTGSSDIVLNPDRYVPSPAPVSRDLGTNFTKTYGEYANSLEVTGKVLSDTISAQGVQLSLDVDTTPNVHVINQRFGALFQGGQIFPTERDGIIGFGNGWTSSSSNSTPFYLTLCAQGQLHQCRFGLGLATDGTGQLVLGGIQSQYSNSMSVAPTFYRPRPDNTTDLNYEWFMSADIAFGDEIVLQDIGLILDSGSRGISGPIDAVETIFEKIQGIHAVHYSRPPEEGGDYVLGYYDCNNPPNFGLSIPSQRAASGAERNGTATSRQGTIFNIARSVTARPSNSTLSNNCTLNLLGTDSLPVSGFWLVGQAFFQGHYVDFNHADGTVGIANLAPSTM